MNKYYFNEVDVRFLKELLDRMVFHCELEDEKEYYELMDSLDVVYKYLRELLNENR